MNATEAYTALARWDKYVPWISNTNLTLCGPQNEQATDGRCLFQNCQLQEHPEACCLPSAHGAVRLHEFQGDKLQSGRDHQQQHVLLRP